jgi:hypothetical protein
MRRTRPIHLGSPPTGPHPPVGLLPRRQAALLLLPVRHRSLIAPLHQTRHRPPVRPRSHIPPHTLCPIPRRHGPKRPVSIRQQFPTLKPLRLPHLPQRLHGGNRKHRHVENRPNAQTCQTHKDHPINPPLLISVSPLPVILPSMARAEHSEAPPKAFAWTADPVCLGGRSRQVLHLLRHPFLFPKEHNENGLQKARSSVSRLRSIHIAGLARIRASCLDHPRKTGNILWNSGPNTKAAPSTVPSR